MPVSSLRVSGLPGSSEFLNGLLQQFVGDTVQRLRYGQLHGGWPACRGNLREGSARLSFIPTRAAFTTNSMKDSDARVARHPRWIRSPADLNRAACAKAREAAF
ncbi:hypothetical protein C9I56_41535 [Paraburkholderia caribensis]|uniref:Uncharacterized protein n=2 Tax=Paraburkholderia TaxID=1822464 RepID=B2JYI2_PARP8|nr:hypothetical protein Bphy_7816 [Paraburkholderia phymatum STM815]AFT90648.1 hypothetical protein BUPH_08435 [Paraburkholderia phenoliruptrix BR3459a]PTB23007.1 hypothetical protein C9I56_41535 [Paraburkholderia caribensis]